MEDLYRTQDCYFPIDDLLDLSNNEIFSNSSSTTSSTDSQPNNNFYAPPPPPPALYNPPTTDFTNDLCLPSEDVADLEWLSRFVDDSFTDFPPPELSSGNTPVPSYRGFTKTPEPVRRCTHCASEKTPQWRTGPLGPKTLCNACGVRYKSGRLVPEYRPAASPTFVLTQHSNSHRKVMELRRQKEASSQQQPEEEEGEQKRRFYLYRTGIEFADVADCW